MTLLLADGLPLGADGLSVGAEGVPVGAEGVPVGDESGGAWVVFPDLALVRNKWGSRALAASRKKIATPPPRVGIRPCSCDICAYILYLYYINTVDSFHTSTHHTVTCNSPNVSS